MHSQWGQYCTQKGEIGSWGQKGRFRCFNGYVTLHSSILSIKSYSLVFKFSHWIFLSITWAALTLEFMEGRQKVCKTFTTKLWQINGHDWGTSSWLMVESWSHMMRGVCMPFNACGCYLCLILSASVCDMGFGN